jgi:hypothetical protein
VPCLGRAHPFHFLLLITILTSSPFPSCQCWHQCNFHLLLLPSFANTTLSLLPSLSYRNIAVQTRMKNKRNRSKPVLLLNIHVVKSGRRDLTLLQSSTSPVPTCVLCCVWCHLRALQSDHFIYIPHTIQHSLLDPCDSHPRMRDRTIATGGFLHTGDARHCGVFKRRSLRQRCTILLLRRELSLRSPRAVLRCRVSLCLEKATT